MKIALILSGPSLKNVDVKNIDADYVVGVNWEFLQPRVQLNVVVDYRCIDRIRSDFQLPDGSLAIDRYTEWLAHGGDFFFVDHASQKTHYPGAVTVKSTFPKWPQYPELIVDGLYCRSNVGLSGLSAACLLIPGRGEIDIYGLDLSSDTSTGKTENHHKNHDQKWAADSDVSYPSMIREFDEARKKIPAGIRVVNMNPKSAYKGFEFAD